MIGSGGGATGRIMTVRGPVSPSEVGPTLSHEHIFGDVRAFWDPSELEDPGVGSAPFESRFGGPARWDSSAFRDDLIQDPATEFDMVAEEVGEFVTAGGSCIVELTSVGLNGSPRDLVRLSERLGLHIVAGAGFYIHDVHPDWLETAEIDEIAAFLVEQAQKGIDGTGVRAGIFGELGTSETLYPCEERVLRAAARAAAVTGVPINVHAHPPELSVCMRILDLLEEEGHDLTRTSVSHLDEILDLDYHARVLDRGALVGFDSFGQDGYFTPTWKSLSDNEKAATLAALIERGYEDQLLMSQDMGKKHYLLRFGGMGYAHVLVRVVPRLRKHYEVGEEAIRKALVDNPRRLLTIV